jgi:hypothetical protein
MSDDTPEEVSKKPTPAGSADPAEVVSAMAHASTNARVVKSRAVLGGFSGFFFGFFIALGLLLAGGVNSSNELLLILPVGFLILGIVLGKTTPFRRA